MEATHVNVVFASKYVFHTPEDLLDQFQTEDISVEYRENKFLISCPVHIQDQVFGDFLRAYRSHIQQASQSSQQNVLESTYISTIEHIRLDDEDLAENGEDVGDHEDKIFGPPAPCATEGLLISHESLSKIYRYDGSAVAQEVFEPKILRAVGTCTDCMLELHKSDSTINVKGDDIDRIELAIRKLGVVAQARESRLNSVTKYDYYVLDNNPRAFRFKWAEAHAIPLALGNLTLRQLYVYVYNLLTSRYAAVTATRKPIEVTVDQVSIWADYRFPAIGDEGRRPEYWPATSTASSIATALRGATKSGAHALLEPEEFQSVEKWITRPGEVIADPSTAKEVPPEAILKTSSKKRETVPSPPRSDVASVPEAKSYANAVGVPIDSVERPTAQKKGKAATVGSVPSWIEVPQLPEKFPALPRSRPAATGSIPGPQSLRMTAPKQSPKKQVAKKPSVLKNQLSSPRRTTNNPTIGNSGLLVDLSPSPSKLTIKPPIGIKPPASRAGSTTPEQSPHYSSDSSNPPKETKLTDWLTNIQALHRANDELTNQAIPKSSTIIQTGKTTQSANLLLADFASDVTTLSSRRIDQSQPKDLLTGDVDELSSTVPGSWIEEIDTRHYERGQKLQKSSSSASRAPYAHQKIDNAFYTTLELARATPGLMTLKLDLGRLFLDISGVRLRTADLEIEPTNWNVTMTSSSEGLGKMVRFSDEVARSWIDAEFLATLVAGNNAARGESGFNFTKRVFYELVIKDTRTGMESLVVVEADGQSQAMQQVPANLGFINVHFPRHIFDARINFTIAAEVEMTARNDLFCILSNMYVPADQAIPEVYSRVQKKHLEIISITAKRQSRHPCQAYSDLRLELTEVFELNLQRDPSTRRYHATFPTEERKANRPRYWQASLISVSAEKCLAENKSLEVGEYAQWTKEDFNKANIVRNMISAATDLVSRMDNVGCRGPRAPSDPSCAPSIAPSRQSTSLTGEQTPVLNKAESTVKVKEESIAGETLVGASQAGNQDALKRRRMRKLYAPTEASVKGPNFW
ncbi:hypothetical protein MMC25_005453 [Agyrium rufum]|nr:hypothetical protein [Agyrium rufum]